MYSYLNKKYESLCARNGVNVSIHTVTDEEVQRFRISEGKDGFLLEVTANLPESLSYEKVLAWGVRELLLPRLNLKTERLHIRRFMGEDCENCLPLLSDKTDSYMDCCLSFDEKDELYYRHVDLFMQREGQYAAILRTTGELVGTVHVFPDEARAVDAMEFGYRIGKPYQRAGYASEMLTVVLNLLQDELLVDTVSAGVLQENAASIALLKKLGFHEEGIRHRATWHEMLDRPVDLLYFYRDRE